jgi:hypothetical protein
MGKLDHQPERRGDGWIILLDGILGTLIGAASLGLSSARSPLVDWSRTEMFLDAMAVMGLLLGIPMFIATVLLAPLLLRFLKRQQALPRGRYYFRSALAGIVFGLAASAGVGFVLGLIVPFLPDMGGVSTTLPERLALLAGAPPFLGLAAGIIGMFYIYEIVVAGTLFGVLNGWLLRRRNAT